MRFVLAILIAGLGLSATSFAQNQSSEYKVKSSKIDAEPKSTAPVKASQATAASSTSKELHSVERENPKGTGAAHTAKRTPKPVALKPDGRDNRNPPMNFGGKGGAASSGLGKQPNPYKGRLKQKGQGGHN